MRPPGPITTDQSEYCPSDWTELVIKHQTINKHEITDEHDEDDQLSITHTHALIH